MLQLLLATLIGLTSAPAAPQDQAGVSPRNYKAEIENEWVRVLRVKPGPHEQTPMREHPASVTVYLTDYHQKITGTDGKAQEVTRKSGEVSYADAAKYAEENLADQSSEAIVVELKLAAPSGLSWPLPLDPVRLDPRHHVVLFENDQVRVLRTVLEPHVKTPLHEHPRYVVVYITDLHRTMTFDDGRQVDNSQKPGEIAWRDPLKHVTENSGDHTTVEVQVELK